MPDNYRGIVLLSVFSKIYTSVLNRRITFYVNMYDKITECQAGFREGYSTVDNAFILNAFVDKYLNKKKGKLYVAFVDFKKAFDSVHREKLWHVLRNAGISGHLYQSIQSIYKSVQSCVRANSSLTNFFGCPIGLKQGCLLSPVLFSIFINELADKLSGSGIKGLQFFPEIIEILMLMFADDIALLSDTIVGLQKQLLVLEEFSDDYKIGVNTDKTKVLVFKKGGKLSKREKWLYKGTPLEVVNGFQYVGLLFTTQMSLNRMANDLALKGKKVLISVLSSLYRYGNLSKTTFFKIFDVKIAPILFYGSELWGSKNYDCLERVHRYACKRFLNVSFKVSNSVALGDCGRFPLYIQTQIRVLKYWFKILHLPDHRYVKKAYNMLHYLQETGQTNWASRVRDILFLNGFGYVWENQHVENEKNFICLFTERLKDQFLQTWSDNVQNSSKLILYKQFKTSFGYEFYLDIINLRKYRNALASFRAGAHDLEIEKGRYLKIPKHERLCKLCIEKEIEDEYHFLFICNAYQDIRQKLIPSKFHTHPNKLIFFYFHVIQKRTICKAPCYLHIQRI